MDDFLFVVIAIIAGVISLIKKANDQEKKKQQEALEAARRRKAAEDTESGSITLEVDDRSLVTCSVCGGMNVPDLSHCLFCNSPLHKPKPSTMPPAPASRQTIFEQAGSGTRFDREAKEKKRERPVREQRRPRRKAARETTNLKNILRDAERNSERKEIPQESSRPATVTEGPPLPDYVSRMREPSGLMEVFILKELLDKPLALRRK